MARSRDENAGRCDVSHPVDEERGSDGVADVRLEGPLDLRALRLPPGLVRHTVTIEAGGCLCAEGAASCGEIIAVDEGAIDVVLASGETQRLHAGALLFVAGLRDVELRCAGPTPAVLTGHPPHAPALTVLSFASGPIGPEVQDKSGEPAMHGCPASPIVPPHDGSVTERRPEHARRHPPRRRRHGPRRPPAARIVRPPGPPPPAADALQPPHRRRAGAQRGDRRVRRRRRVVGRPGDEPGGHRRRRPGEPRPRRPAPPGVRRQPRRLGRHAPVGRVAAAHPLVARQVLPPRRTARRRRPRRHVLVPRVRRQHGPGPPARGADGDVDERRAGRDRRHGVRRDGRHGAARRAAPHARPLRADPPLRRLVRAGAGVGQHGAARSRPPSRRSRPARRCWRPRWCGCWR